MTPRDWIAAALVPAGVFFSLVAALGVARLPDTYLRMHASTKSVTLGTWLVALGVALQLGTPTAAAFALLICLLFALTTPVSGHVLARAAYRAGNPLWINTHRDDLAAQPWASSPATRPRTHAQPGQPQPGHVKDSHAQTPGDTIDTPVPAPTPPHAQSPTTPPRPSSPPRPNP